MFLVQLQTEGESLENDWKHKKKKYNASTLNVQQPHLQGERYNYADRSQTITYFYW